MIENTSPTTSTWVDPDDAPELDEDFFRTATPMIGDTVVSQAAFKAAAPRGRPRKAEAKVAVTIRYDADIIHAFRATGQGWQTRMNDALRHWLNAHPTRT